MPVAGHALGLNLTLLKGFEQRAAGFAVMLAVAKTAIAEQVAELDKPSFDIVPTDMAQAELADAGGVDQFAATREMEQACGCGGVCAFAGLLRERSDAGVDAWQEAIDQ